MIKIAAFDVDHTLYTLEGINPTAVEAIHKLQDNKILFVVATGRCAYALDMISDAKLEYDYLVGASGAIVSDKQGNIIAINTLSKETVENLTKDAETNEFELVFKFKDASYIYNKYEQTMEYLKFMQNVYQFTFNGEDHTRHLKDLPLGAVIHGDAKLIEEIASKYEDLDFLPFAEGRYDIVQKGIGKDWGLKQLCNYLNLDATNIIAFGDNYNDITMLKYVGIGIAMGNGEHCVKAIADDICDSADNDGIAKALERYKLI
ncbi:MAG: HAD family hydrolase [Erysipelotrichaceae bacterium]